MRLGPLVYLLPLYSPLRLIEEISMLDHLSYGRLEVGVGRGVSPFELKYHKVEHDDSRDIFMDAFRCISAGLITDRLSYSGPHFTYENVPIALRPLQQPHPAFWYGSSNTIGSTWAGEHGLHFHAVGTCEGPDFKSAGGHLNPEGHQHGMLNPMGSHLGDLPNFIADAQGHAQLQIALDQLPDKLLPHLFDADGTAIVVHAAADDYRTDPSGNSGARIACGVLRKP